MSSGDVDRRIRGRFEALGLALTPTEERQLLSFFWCLAKWNAKMNLTAFQLESAEEEAIDRLLVEPFAAAKLLDQPVSLAVDLGSGGGSPALPMRIASAMVRLVMIESKARKCAFLREAVREVGLAGVDVVHDRFEAAAVRPDLRAQASLVTIRAIRADETLLETLDQLVRPGGSVFWFGREAREQLSSTGSLRFVGTHELIPALGARQAATVSVFNRP